MTLSFPRCAAAAFPCFHASAPDAAAAPAAILSLKEQIFELKPSARDKILASPVVGPLMLRHQPDANKTQAQAIGRSTLKARFETPARTSTFKTKLAPKLLHDLLAAATSGTDHSDLRAEVARGLSNEKFMNDVAIVARFPGSRQLGGGRYHNAYQAAAKRLADDDRLGPLLDRIFDAQISDHAATPVSRHFALRDIGDSVGLLIDARASLGQRNYI
jgi:hypothetical protein